MAWRKDQGSGQWENIDTGEVWQGDPNVNPNDINNAAPDVVNQVANQDPYYQKYINAYSKMGATPKLDATAFQQLKSGWRDPEGGLAGLLETTLYPEAVRKYNQNVRDYYKAQGLTPSPSELKSETWDTESMGDWRGKGSDWLLGKISDVASKANEYATSAKDVATQAETTKANAYKFEMPTEWQTIEDMASATLKQGRPTFTPESVTQWENKLEQAYSPTREKLKTNMANYWAKMFPQGGGSGRQSQLNAENLTALELDKLNRAMGFAETDVSQKLQEYLNAPNILQQIGGFKAQAGQFKSAQDAATAWQNAQMAWEKAKAGIAQEQEAANWNRQKSLAESLAALSKPQSTDIATTLANSLAGGLGTAGGYAGMAKLLALLSSGGTAAPALAVV